MTFTKRCYFKWLPLGRHSLNVAIYTPHKRSLAGGGGCIGITLSVRLSVQSKLDLDRNFLTKSDTALILHRCIPCDKTFLSIRKFLTLWPWPWLLTNFWKNLTLATTFEPKEMGLSYFTCVFLVARPSCWNKNFYLVTLTLTFDLLLKKLDLDHNFWTNRALILNTSISCDKTFLLIPIFLT